MIFKKTSKGVALITATVLLLGGCGVQKGEKNIPIANPNGDMISEQHEELTFFLQASRDKRFEEQEVPMKAAEITNVTVKQFNSSNITTIQEAFTLMMSTGDMADIVQYLGRDYFNEYGAEGAFAPLNDLIDKYAPNYKAFLERNPDVKKAITNEDGTIYCMMTAEPEGVIASQGWLVRQDWLDKLGLKAPTTVEEMHDVLKAFVENDPNGNGIKDEVGYLNRLNSEAMDPLLALWDARSGFYVDDNKICYGPVEEAYGTAYSNIAKWYAEGLIDKEIYTRGSKSRDKLFGENLGGMTHDWFGSTCQFNDMLKESNPEFKLVPFLPPAGKEVKSRGGLTVGSAVGISAASPNKELAMKWIDFWFSKTGSRLINYGLEGVHYDMIDGIPTFKDSVLNNKETVLTQLNRAGAQRGPLFVQDFNYEKQWLNTEALKGIEEYEKSGLIEPKFPVLNFTEEEQREIEKYMNDINTYVSECSQKWVLGSVDCEAEFDEYVENLKKLNVERVVELYQNAYDRYVEN